MNTAPNIALDWPSSVVIVASPAANLRSIFTAVQRIRQQALRPPFSLVVSDQPEQILAAERVIFPGVGHAGFVMAELRRSGLDAVLRQVQKPLLGICVGMQLLFEEFSEGGPQHGLGLLPGPVLPLRPAIAAVQPAQRYPVPHIGWNPIAPPTVLPTDTDPAIVGTGGTQRQAVFDLLCTPPGSAGQDTCGYFVHSFFHPLSCATLAVCEYGGVAISALVRGSSPHSHIWGCQFHPEKSGAFGAAILYNWLTLSSQV